MYADNQTANNFLDGNMGSLSAGKLRYAGWRGKMTKPRNFPQETAETTGNLFGMGTLFNNPKDINCDNAIDVLKSIIKNAYSNWKQHPEYRIEHGAFAEWAWQNGANAYSLGKGFRLGNSSEYVSCICPTLFFHMGKSSNDATMIEVVEYNGTSVVQRIMTQKSRIGGSYIYPWQTDIHSIDRRYFLIDVRNVPTVGWMQELWKSQKCKTGGGGTSCPAPCVLDEKGNCMKTCNGVVIPCDKPCEPETPPTPGTDCCEICEATSKKGTTQFYLSKNKTDKSIPVMVRGKTIECIPKNPDKQYQWDCDQVIKQIESYLGNSPNTNTASGVGHLGFGVIGSGYVGARKVTAGEIAGATANTPCPCDCKEIDGQVQMYVNTNKTGEGDIPFTLPYTTVDCKGKGGLNPDGTPKDKISNLKINCDDIKNAIAQQGYSMSGFGDCGCGDCGQQGMGDLSGGQIAAYVVGAGIFSLALFYVFGNKIKGL